MFLHCSTGSLCSSFAVYAARASMAIRSLGSRAIIPGARWYVVCVSFSVSGCAPLPPLPRG
nr:MAG TPA: putative phosphatase [Caudoviricetes sp.]